MSNEIQTMHNPVAIANWFTKKSEYGFDLVQLLKLSYIAHGFKLGLHSAPMANEYVEAWKYGPVFPSIYYEFRYRVENPSDKIKVLGAEIDEISPAINPFTKEEQKILQRVFEIYGKFDGWQLSKLTHEEGTPWHKAYHEKDGYKFRGVTIENKEIKNYFKTKIVEKYELGL